MKSLIFLTTAFLLFGQTTFLQAQTREVNEIEIKGAFTKYLESPSWSARSDLITPSAWNDHVGSILYAYKNAATTLLVEYKIENYHFPKWPSNFKGLPKKDAIEARYKAKEKLLIDLSNKLGVNLGEFIDTIALETYSSSPDDYRLADINVLASQTNATAECHCKGDSVSIPMRFKLVNGIWKYDGINSVLRFDRQRKTDE